MRTVLRHWDSLDDDKRRDLLTRALDGADTLASSISTWEEATTDARVVLSEPVEVAETPEDGDRGPDLGSPGRVRLSTIATERSSEGFTARVVLDDGRASASGETRTSAGRRSEDRSIVRATLEALTRRLGEGVEVDDVDVVQAGEERVALVALTSGRQVLLGSALVTSDDHEAMSRATLDALNRVAAKPGSEGHSKNRRP